MLCVDFMHIDVSTLFDWNLNINFGNIKSNLLDVYSYLGYFKHLYALGW